MKSVLTPLEFLARSAAVNPSCTAAVDGERRFTYAEFQQRVHAFASALQQSGITPGDRVAVLARNGLLALEAHFAVPLIGAVLVMLNIRLQCAELVDSVELDHVAEPPELKRALQLVQALADRRKRPGPQA